MSKFEADVCEVCYEPLFPVHSLSPEIQDKVYRPGVDGLVEDVEFEIDRPKTHSGGAWELIENADE